MDTKDLVFPPFPMSLGDKQAQLSEAGVTYKTECYVSWRIIDRQGNCLYSQDDKITIGGPKHG
jgi:hypothetical protein